MERRSPWVAETCNGLTRRTCLTLGNAACCLNARRARYCVVTSFTEGGSDHPPVTEADILEPSERFRGAMDYYSHAKHGRQILTRLAGTRPTMLARMHGSGWRGDGAAMLMALADALAG